MTEQERLKKEIEYAKTEIIKNERLFRCIKICDTPKSLQAIRIDNLPILYTFSHLRKALKNKDFKKHYHGLTEQQILNIPKLLEEPALIMFDSNKEHNADIMIFVEDYDKEKLPIIYSLKVNGKGIYNDKKIESNILLTVYGTLTMETDIAREIKNKNIIYYDKEKIERILKTKRFGQNLDQCLQLQPLQDTSIPKSNEILQYFHKVVKIDYSKDKSLTNDEKLLADSFKEDIKEGTQNYTGVSERAEKEVIDSIKKDLKKEKKEDKEYKHNIYKENDDYNR